MTNWQQPQENTSTLTLKKKNKTKEKTGNLSLIPQMFPLGIMTVMLIDFQTSKRLSFGKHLYCCYCKVGSYGPILFNFNFILF